MPAVGNLLGNQFRRYYNLVRANIVDFLSVQMKPVQGKCHEAKGNYRTLLRVIRSRKDGNLSTGLGRSDFDLWRLVWPLTSCVNCKFWLLRK